MKQQLALTGSLIYSINKAFMFQFLRNLSYLFISILLLSCASTEKPESYDDIAADSASYKYEAWRLNDAVQSEAIKVLLSEIDALIEDTRLQLSDWSFISTASKALNDEDNYLRAQQKIDALTSF